jgi:hypothetical protein
VVPVSRIDLPKHELISEKREQGNTSIDSIVVLAYIVMNLFELFLFISEDVLF